jgi:hypothetical protein
MYKIIGADQKEYGPISADQVRQWIRDGRVNAHTQARLEPDGSWQPLSAFPEFADVLQPGVAAPGPAAPAFMSPGGGGSASREAALQAVKAPAICLIVVAGLGIAIFLFGAVANFLGGAMLYRPMPSNIPPEMQSFYRSMQSMQGPLGGLINLFFAAMNGLVLLGGIKMLKLESRTLVLIACIIAMLPFTVYCCCLLGLPFGIWALVVINKAEVRSQFT